MAFPSYHLPLNRSALIFFPSIVSTNHGVQVSKPHVTQVIIKTKWSTSVKPHLLNTTDPYIFSRPSVGTLAAFYLAQGNITKTIESLVYAHILAPFPEEIILEGKGYVLRGERVKWTYGADLKGRLFWDAPGKVLEGGELGEVEMATDKWKFWFQDVCKTRV